MLQKAKLEKVKCLQRLIKTLMQVCLMFPVKQLLVQILTYILHNRSDCEQDQ